MTIRILTGDCRDVLPTLDAGSVHCVVTSPPYYGLRDYGTAQWDGGDANCRHIAPQGGPSAKQESSAGTRQIQHREQCPCGARRIDRQIGLEATPDEYIQTMVEVFREVRRVLRDDGTVWCNMGDSFSSKQLLMMPARLALALQADGWWLRSDIIWAKPNPMPESCRDRPTSAHEHIFLLTKAARYFYDAEAVREEAEYGRREGTNWKRAMESSVSDKRRPDAVTTQGADPGAGRNLRNVWEIATHPYSAAHFATFPPELAERCIRAGTSERGCCAQCGKPWVRVTERESNGGWSAKYAAEANEWQPRQGGIRGRRCGGADNPAAVTTTGWSPSCQCNAEVAPCVVLDPFSGAGTTGLVSDRLGRDAIMIDLSHQYVEMARKRLQADCPLFADITDAPVPEPPEDERMADLFAEAAD